jgi:hypothetical protein
VSLVSPSDTRLLTDIEKLIKITADVEPLPLEDAGARPVGRYNDGRRHWGRDTDDDEPNRPARSDSTREAAGRGRGSSRSSPRAPVDPFFDKPYEPGGATGEVPAWEKAAKPVGRPVSANIRSKKRVPALFKAPQVAVPAESAVPPVDHISAPVLADSPALG